MDKFILTLVLLAVLSACTIAKPIDAIKSRGSSVLRAVALYANPFGWIGTPSIIRRATTRVKKSDERSHYSWFIEIDGNYHPPPVTFIH